MAANEPGRASEMVASNVRVVRWMLIAFGLTLGLIGLWLIKDIVMLTLTAIIFSILLTSPIRFFVRRGLSRPLSVILTIILIIVVIAAVTALVLPGLLEQFRILAVQTIPSAWDLLQRELQPEVLTERYPFLRGLVNDLPRQLNDQMGSMLSTLGGQLFPFLGNVVSTVVSVIIVIFLSLYFVADPGTHWRGMLRLVPIPYRPRARQILAKLDLALRRFLQAQIILMLLAGMATGIALTVMRVPLSGALGVITGLFSFVPNFGPIIALIPIVAVAIINTPDQVFLLLVIFFAIQFVVSQVVTPLLLGAEINLAPAMILLSQIIAGVFFGFLGVLLSAPLAAIVTVIVREVYIRDVLGDTDFGQRRTAEIPLVPESVFQ